MKNAYAASVFMPTSIWILVYEIGYSTFSVTKTFFLGEGGRNFKIDSWGVIIHFKDLDQLLQPGDKLLVRSGTKKVLSRCTEREDYSFDVILLPITLTGSFPWL